MTVPGATAGAVVATAVEMFGPGLAQVCMRSQIWVNGEPAGADAPVGPDDEVAVVPPVSGGCVRGAEPVS